MGYANTVWFPYRKADEDKIERVQKKATRMIPGVIKLKYEERLHALKLPTLKYRRLKGDMIELYKFISGKYDTDCTLNLSLYSVLHSDCKTRGNQLKLATNYCKYDIRKYCFVNRCVPIRNSLPDDVVLASSTNLCKNRLDRSIKGFCMIMELLICQPEVAS
jgi:ribonucleases P/MRP protein subunit RPP40